MLLGQNFTFVTACLVHLVYFLPLTTIPQLPRSPLLWRKDELDHDWEVKAKRNCARKAFHGNRTKQNKKSLFVWLRCYETRWEKRQIQHPSNGNAMKQWWRKFWFGGAEGRVRFKSRCGESLGDGSSTLEALARLIHLNSSCNQWPHSLGNAGNNKISRLDTHYLSIYLSLSVYLSHSECQSQVGNQATPRQPLSRPRQQRCGGDDSLECGAPFTATLGRRSAEPRLLDMVCRADWRRSLPFVSKKHA